MIVRPHKFKVIANGYFKNFLKEIFPNSTKKHVKFNLNNTLRNYL